MAVFPVVASAISKEEIEDIASDLVALYAPQRVVVPGPFPIEELIEFDLQRITGAVLRACVLRDDELAITWIDNQEDRLAIYLSESTLDLLGQGDREARITAGHEVGHVQLHEVPIRFLASLPEHQYAVQACQLLKGKNLREMQVEHFTRHLLVPPRALEVAITSFGLNVAALAQCFQIPEEEMRARLGTRWGATQMALVGSQGLMPGSEWGSV